LTENADKFLAKWGFSPGGEGRYVDGMTFVWATKGTWAGLCNREDIAHEQSSQRADNWLSKTGARPDGLASFVIGRRAQALGLRTHPTQNESITYWIGCRRVPLNAYLSADLGLSFG
jgi:hypothetical protein